MKIKELIVTLSGILAIIFFYSCKSNKSEISFNSQKIVDNARFLWAMSVNDVTGDGIKDLVFIDNNSAGGILGYYKGQTGKGLWEEVIIAEEPPTGGTFASGDLETADMDGDGDIDVLGIKHTGEWDNAEEPSEIFWYENPGWEAHVIGTAPNFIKDLIA